MNFIDAASLVARGLGGGRGDSGGAGGDHEAESNMHTYI